MSVEGPIIAMQHSPSLGINSPGHLTNETSAMSRQVQMLATPHRRERALSMGDVSSEQQSMTDQLSRRPMSPLASQVGLWNLFTGFLVRILGYYTQIELLLSSKNV